MSSHVSLELWLIPTFPLTEGTFYSFQVAVHVLPMLHLQIIMKMHVRVTSYESMEYEITNIFQLSKSHQSPSRREYLFTVFTRKLFRRPFRPFLRFVLWKFLEFVGRQMISKIE